MVGRKPLPWSLPELLTDLAAQPSPRIPRPPHDTASKGLMPVAADIQDLAPGHAWCPFWKVRVSPHQLLNVLNITLGNHIYIFPLLPSNKWGSCCLWGYSETSWVVTVLTIFTTGLPHFGIGKSQDPQSWTPSHHPTSTTGSCPLCTCHPTATHARQWSLTPHSFDWSFGSPYFVLLRAKFWVSLSVS